MEIPKKYNPKQVERFLLDARRLELPILLGLCPLASYRNAIFLHENVPGMRIPENILKRMQAADEIGQGAEEGIQIAREALGAVKDLVQGAYIMPPFGRTYLAEKVLKGWITPKDKHI